MSVEQHCITCRRDGHIYLDCPEAPFASLLAAAFGLPDIFNDRAQVAKNLRRLRSTDPLSISYVPEHD